MRIKILLILLIVTFVCAGIVCANQDIVISGAWVRPMPPSHTVTAAFLVIENVSNEDVVLESASADICETVEIHEMIHEDGMMRMRMLENGLRIPSHGKIVLEPGGNHLMLFDLLRPAAEGEKVMLTLRFSGGRVIETEALIREPLQETDIHSHH